MATNITAITDTNNSAGSKGPKQFQGLFDVIPFQANVDDDSLAAQIAGQCAITVPGAALGDLVHVAIAADTGAQIAYGYVSAANVVTVTTFNVEGEGCCTQVQGQRLRRAVKCKA
jgi:hypothetical protein